MHQISTPAAHEDLFAQPTIEATQPTLLDFRSQLPTPSDDPDEDLIVAPLSDRALWSSYGNIREGTIVSINTAYQGKVHACDAFESHDFELEENSSLTEYQFKAHTVIPFNSCDIPFLWLIKTGSRFGEEGTILYQLPDGTTASVQHLAIDNENNLRSEIDTDRYETFKSYVGDRVLRIEDNAYDVVKLKGTEDGVVTYDQLSGCEQTETINGQPSSPSWFLPGDELSGRDPTFLRGGSDPVTGQPVDSEELDSDHIGVPAVTLDAEQCTALQALVRLPELTYNPNEAGLTCIAKNERVTTSTKEFLDTAFPYADVDESSWVCAAPYERDALSGLHRPITDIIGIGDATAADISGVKRQSLRSKTLSELKEADDEIITVTEVDEPSTELKEARKNFEPSQSSTEDSIYDIEEFCDEGLPLFDISGQYFAKAVEEVRTTLEDNIDDLDLTLVNMLLTLHAGATRGRLYDNEASNVGLVANLMLDTVDIEDVETVAAWNNDKTSASPLYCEEHDERIHLLTQTDDIEAIDVGGLTYSIDSENPAPADGVEPVGNHLTLYSTGEPPANLAEQIPDDEVHDGIQFTAGKVVGDGAITHSLTRDAAQYVVSLFDLDLTDPTIVREHVRLAPERIYVDHPDDQIDLTFIIADFQR